MHLTEVKLSGFKTFVDPTKIKLNSDLICVVGPNGCGKSNILDAICWVLGESSHKAIRTSEGEDVIFNGSKGRAKSDRASVELIFDNSDQKIRGKFGQYEQISLKRQLVRSEISKYFINNQQVRRKDIVSLFLGTGLGANSYALIQQGFISQIVDSKPDELRQMVEEAAQISQYKQRRHETSLRIKHTLENLDRVNDLKDEIKKQCNHLKYQAKVAKRYRKLKEELNQKKIEVIALNYQFLAGQKDDFDHNLKQLSVDKIANDANFSAIEKQQIDLKEKKNDFLSQREQKENLRYSLGQKIARIEEQIKQINYYLSNFENQKISLKQNLENQKQLAQSEKNKLDEQNAKLIKLTQNIAKTDQTYQNNQLEFESLNKQKQTIYYQLLKAETAKNNLEENSQNQLYQINQFKQTINSQSEQLSLLGEELSQLREQKFNHKIKELQDQIKQKNNQFEQFKQTENHSNQAYEKILVSHRTIKNKLTNLEKKINTHQAQIQAKEQLLKSLEGEVALESKAKLKNWGINYQLIAQKIGIDKKWEKLLMLILPQMAAINLTDTKSEKQLLGYLDDQLKNQTAIDLEWFVSQKNNFKPANSSINLSSLLQLCKKSKNIPATLAYKLSQIYVCDDFALALQLRSKLNLSETILCANGIWLSQDWLKVIDFLHEQKNNPIIVSKSIIKLKQKLKKDQLELSEKEKKLEQITKAKEQIQKDLDNNQDKKQTLSLMLNQHKQDLLYFENQQKWCQEKIAKIKHNQNQLKDSLTENQKRLDQLDLPNNQHNQTEIEHSYQKIKEQYQTIEQKYNVQKEKILLEQNQLQELKDKQLTAKNQIEYTQQNNHRIAQEIASLVQKLENLSHEQSEQQINQQNDLEISLKQSLNEQQDLDQQIKLIDEQISQIDQSLNQQSEKLENAKNKQFTIEKQQNTIDLNLQQITDKQKQLLKDLLRLEKNLAQNDSNNVQNSSIDLLTEKIQIISQNFAAIIQEQKIDNHHLEQWQQQSDQLELKINKMDNVNLSAISDYEQSQQKLDYLNNQSDDIEQALESLKKAIRKIDQESKKIFETTFNQINEQFSNYFPVLFQGGSASLEMIEDDSLNSGIIIKAQPFGKKNKHIRQLSGGEKALTAIALIFAFFSLNPAPFCVLDEIDAPLDDHNTYMFLELVKQKCNEVQFIFITHNKTTMQKASQLLGITMKDPGISKVVSVDINKAIALVE